MSTTSDDKQTNLKLYLLPKTQPYKLFYNRHTALHTFQSILGYDVDCMTVCSSVLYNVTNRRAIVAR